MLLAQLGINEILNDGATTAQSIAEGWDEQWVDLLQNNTDISRFHALPGNAYREALPAL